MPHTDPRASICRAVRAPLAMRAPRILAPLAMRAPRILAPLAMRAPRILAPLAVRATHASPLPTPISKCSI